MSLKDYKSRIDRLQKGLGKAFIENPFILNIPGKSIALKVDPYYYVAFEPAFTENLCRFGVMLPKNVRDTLVRTGNLVIDQDTRNPLIKIRMKWNDRSYAMNVCFVESEFIDQALKIYGGVTSDVGLSELRILSSERERLDTFFGERTLLKSVAYID
ncbi:hypothetical protein [Maridesulfovibrio hydrothermalis]|uniref:Uncharacterized protein n=1 Tax=Maridesulfovibrio hydrothermalis AM13 = DSM 14728 TaxID=1121451 RepID=L0RG05_9BACT|nr:hypothetical protein [Maridesulfovibrio hydrothermalis]CCO25167.1 conserved protein of unknown function [Maridesulfovibrio hydrothermalis AM13 = DSM 14728]